MKARVAVIVLALGALLLGTGFAGPGFVLSTRPRAAIRQQEAVWLMLAVNDTRAYERGLASLWDVGPDKWDATGKALSDRERSFLNSAVVPALGTWHRVYTECPVEGWNTALLGQR